MPRLALVRRALSSGDVAPLVWLSFVATFAFIGMESTFALFGQRRFDYDTVQMGLLFVYIGVMARSRRDTWWAAWSSAGARRG